MQSPARAKKNKKQTRYNTVLVRKTEFKMTKNARDVFGSKLHRPARNSSSFFPPFPVL